MQLDGKVAAVSGASAGIGYGIAKAFLAEGAKVVISGRNAERGAKAIAELGATDRTVFVNADSITKEGCIELVETTVAEFGRIDILVNNAGGATDLGAATVDLDDDLFDNIMKWNLYSTFWTTKAALKHMIPQEYGRIINISSVEGKGGKAAVTPYCTAKHAIHGFTKAVAKETGLQGVTINCICPGLILTDAVINGGQSLAEGLGISFDDLVGIFTADSAIKRTNTVEEVAAVSVLLASEVASGITGAMWSVDGGTAQY